MCRFSKDWSGVGVELVIPVITKPLLDIRLPTTFLPFHYDVLLQPDLETTIGPDDKDDDCLVRKYEGRVSTLMMVMMRMMMMKVSMNVRAQQDTKVFTFHADKLQPELPTVTLMVRISGRGVLT